MNETIVITIPNLAAVERTFAMAPRNMLRELDRAVQKTGILIERNSKVEAPVNKQTGGGNLRQSIRFRKTGTAKGVVEVGAEYGVYVHGGTRPHVIRIRNKRVLANKRTGQVFGRVVHHPGTKANPFLQRGVDRAQPSINKYFTDAVIKALQ